MIVNRTGFYGRNEFEFSEKARVNLVFAIKKLLKLLGNYNDCFLPIFKLQLEKSIPCLLTDLYVYLNTQQVSSTNLSILL